MLLHLTMQHRVCYPLSMQQPVFNVIPQLPAIEFYFQTELKCRAGDIPCDSNFSLRTLRYQHSQPSHSVSSTDVHTEAVKYRWSVALQADLKTAGTDPEPPVPLGEESSSKRANGSAVRNKFSVHLCLLSPVLIQRNTPTGRQTLNKECTIDIFIVQILWVKYQLLLSK